MFGAADSGLCALVVMERSWYQASASEFIASGGRAFEGEYRHAVVAAERLSLGTPYPRVVSWVREVTAWYSEACLAGAKMSNSGQLEVESP